MAHNQQVVGSSPAGPNLIMAFINHSEAIDKISAILLDVNLREMQTLRTELQVLKDQNREFAIKYEKLIFIEAHDLYDHLM